MEVILKEWIMILIKIERLFLTNIWPKKGGHLAVRHNTGSDLNRISKRYCTQDVYVNLVMGQPQVYATSVGWPPFIGKSCGVIW